MTKTPDPGEKSPGFFASPPGTADDADAERWMRLAIQEANEAGRRGEVPVGAVVVRDGRVIATGHNLTQTLQDPTAHAEMLALRAAAQAIGHWRLLDCTLYVTLEPCAMCAGAIVLARVPRLVYGARDPKAGMCGSLENLVRDARLNHRVELIAGVLEPECGELLRVFFRQRRAAAKKPIVQPPED